MRVVEQRVQRPRRLLRARRRVHAPLHRLHEPRRRVSRQRAHLLSRVRFPARVDADRVDEPTGRGVPVVGVVPGRGVMIGAERCVRRVRGRRRRRRRDDVGRAVKREERGRVGVGRRRRRHRASGCDDCGIRASTRRLRGVSARARIRIYRCPSHRFYYKN